ncbi:nucleotide-binding universal stress UspA family protein [Sagittula marina]|uniref:Nucleotide-binding universal stress UspA family protein n=1 Tax=Sagittula marina TaxID=943940 RepID=A0A7W6GSP7_9RHOB|nr:universal stress protein [Sagittula marina]MBB3986225.1 nucleotide-binding universal stress UspA family protein [Sagittula marina]
MFQKIVVPVDLTHADKLNNTLQIVADLAMSHGAEVCYVGVTATTPTAAAHSPEEYAAKLTEFATAQGQKGFATSAKALTAPDPAVDTDKKLLTALKDIGADLVVMQTHAPNAADYIWSGHGASIAAHADASVFLVRD